MPLLNMAPSAGLERISHRRILRLEIRMRILRHASFAVLRLRAVALRATLAPLRMTRRTKTEAFSKCLC
jgi:hypothetical protein